MARPVDSGYDDSSVVVLPNEFGITAVPAGYHFELSRQQFQTVAATCLYALIFTSMVLVYLIRSSALNDRRGTVMGFVLLGVVVILGASMSLYALWLGIRPVYAC